MIKFYNSNEKPYGCFSNFFPSKMIIDGIEWSTVEHYFQAMKFPHNPEIREIIRSAIKPIETKQLANKQFGYLVNWGKWNETKNTVMYEALKAKFTQNDELRQILIATKHNEIIEHTKNDSYWGDAGDGSGQNILGKLLMRLRNEMISELNKLNL